MSFDYSLNHTEQSYTKDVSLNSNEKTNETSGSEKKSKESIFNATDKNNNGIIDEADFSENDLRRLNSNNLLTFFKGKKWSDSIKDVMGDIFNKDSKEIDENIKFSMENGGDTISVIYDKKNRILKMASQHEGSDRYYDYQDFKYDDQGNLLLFRDYNPSVKKKDGTKFWIKDNGASYVAMQEGFPSLGRFCDVSKDSQLLKEHFANRDKFIWTKEISNYDSEGKVISHSLESPSVLGRGGEERVELADDGTLTTYDYNNNVISKRNIMDSDE